jgi:hypothetical protein
MTTHILQTRFHIVLCSISFANAWLESAQVARQAGRAVARNNNLQGLQQIQDSAVATNESSGIKMEMQVEHCEGP